MAANVICDTDVMIEFWDNSTKRHKSTRQTIEEEIGLDNIVLSAITKMELMLGAVNKADLSKIDKRLSRFNISLLDEEITVKGFELLKTYRLSHGLMIPDCLIAATALVTGLPLFTYNTKDFSYLPQLQLYKAGAKA